MRTLGVRVWEVRKIIYRGLKRGERRGQRRSESAAETPDTIGLNCGWNRVTVALCVFTSVCENTAQSKILKLH